jgi:hypothetical protein
VRSGLLAAAEGALPVVLLKRVKKLCSTTGGAISYITGFGMACLRAGGVKDSLWTS